MSRLDGRRVGDVSDGEHVVPLGMIELHRRFHVQRSLVAQQRGFFLRDQLVIMFLTRADDLQRKVGRQSHVRITSNLGMDGPAGRSR